MPLGDNIVAVEKHPVQSTGPLNQTLSVRCADDLLNEFIDCRILDSCQIT